MKISKLQTISSFLSALTICYIFTLVFFPIDAHADKESDFRVLVDVSGSMKQSDPSDMRQPAVDLLIRLAPEKSLMGIWTFGQHVDMLVPHRRISKNWRDFSSSQVDHIHSSAIRTNIGLALEMMLAEENVHVAKNRSDTEKTVLLLTDGVVDISPDVQSNEKERLRIIEQLLPELQNSGLTIHTIALSENADQALLKQLSLATDGVFTVAESADQLTSVFLSVFDLSFPVSRIPIDNQGFLIDSGADEFTLLVIGGDHASLQLKNPLGFSINASNELSNVNWFSSSDYSLITVSQPEIGKWFVDRGLTQQARVSIVSDVSLRLSDIANNIYPRTAMVIDAVLTETGHPIDEQKLIELIMVDYRLRNPSGDIVEGKFSLLDENKAHYQAAFDDLTQRGSYQLTVTARTDTFHRQQIKSFIVHDSFYVDFSVDNTTQTLSLEVLIIDPSIIGQKIDLSVMVETGNEIIEEVSLTQKNNGSWSYTSSWLEGGNYSLRLQAHASDALLELNEFEAANLSFSIEGEEILTPISDVAQDQDDDDRSNAEEGVFSKNIWFFSLLTLANAVLIAIFLVIYRRYFIFSERSRAAETNDEGLLDVKNQDEENQAVVSHKDVDMDTINPSLVSEVNDIDSDFDISQSYDTNEDSDNNGGR
ncbi:MAG: hypothetical protein CBD32_02930 [Actinobacteria bacterium TMED172]|nr:hypothetical protein [Cellvibrionales bacterium]OUW33420.1 MAG: hypothetical protein CBD32_02930 [Actinobacteria bacterium TMED172]